MKRKIEILETAESLLVGGPMNADQRSRYPRWLVTSVLSKGYDSLLSSQFEQWRSGMFPKNQFLLDNYTKTYTPQTTPPVVVQYDTVRKQYYIDLPSPVIALANNDGIRLVSPTENESGYGVPVTTVQSAIRSSLTVSKINTRFTYRIERTRLWLTFPIVVMENLMLKLVVPFDSLTDLDEVDEPAIMTKNGLYTIYDYVKQNLIPMPVTKQTENNDPNQ